MALLENKNIFIVEDNLHNRVIFQLALIRHGATMDFERWGRNAVSRLKEMTSQIDLIILDLMLADGISGFDLYDEISVLPKLTTVPIVAVSAMDSSIAIPKTRSKGFAGFIAKPIDNALFPEQVAKIISGEKVWYAGERHLT